MRDLDTKAFDMNAVYNPTAIYLEDADSIEYVREDSLSVYRRIDPTLTLIYDLENRDKLIGFRLKGFKNIYLNYLKDVVDNFSDFIALVSVIEKAITIAGDNFFEENDRKQAYAEARKIALEDGVALKVAPTAA